MTFTTHNEVRLVCCCFCLFAVENKFVVFIDCRKTRETKTTNLFSSASKQKQQKSLRFSENPSQILPKCLENPRKSLEVLSHRNF